MHVNEYVGLTTKYDGEHKTGFTINTVDSMYKHFYKNISARSAVIVKGKDLISSNV